MRRQPIQRSDAKIKLAVGTRLDTDRGRMVVVVCDWVGQGHSHYVVKLVTEHDYDCTERQLRERDMRTGLGL